MYKRRPRPKDRPQQTTPPHARRNPPSVSWTQIRALPTANPRTPIAYREDRAPLPTVWRVVFPVKVSRSIYNGLRSDVATPVRDLPMLAVGLNAATGSHVKGVFLMRDSDDGCALLVLKDADAEPILQLLGTLDAERATMLDQMVVAGDGVQLTISEPTRETLPGSRHTMLTIEAAR